MLGDTLTGNIAIYALYDGWGKVRYVGRTTWLRKRFIQHCRLRPWAVGIKVLEWVNAETWRQAEGDWISYYRKNDACLENKNNGGGGALFLTAEHKRKIGDHFRGIPRSPEFRKKVSIGKTGYKYTGQALENIANANRARAKSPSMETRLKLSEANKGRISPSKGIVHTEEYKQKMSESCKKILKTPEWNRKNSEGLKRWYALHPEAAEAKRQKQLATLARKRKGI